MALKRKMFRKQRKGKYVKKSGMVKKKSITAIVEKALSNKVEYHHRTFYYAFSVYNYVTEGSARLKSGFHIPMSGWPQQGDYSFNRNGRSIKNVTQVFKICLNMYGAQSVATASVNCQIPFHIWRVIIWTLPENYSGTANIEDFFRTNTDNSMINMIPINRSKIIVIKDKTFTCVNPYFSSVDVPFTTSTIPRYNCAMKILTVKRRWKVVTFPAENSSTPSKQTTNTFLTVLPVNINGANQTVNPIGNVEYRTVTYYLE